jgi:hypothetical protein
MSHEQDDDDDEQAAPQELSVNARSKLRDLLSHSYTTVGAFGGQLALPAATSLKPVISFLSGESRAKEEDGAAAAGRAMRQRRTTLTQLPLAKKSAQYDALVAVSNRDRP